MPSDRVSVSVPQYAAPYNLPAKPEMYRPPCPMPYRGASPGSIYKTAAGVYGNCAGGYAAPIPGFDFVCPKSELCYSMTSPLVADSPAGICCGTARSPMPLLPPPSAAGLGSLRPAQNWRPHVMVKTEKDLSRAPHQ